MHCCAVWVSQRGWRMRRPHGTPLPWRQGGINSSHGTQGLNRTAHIKLAFVKHVFFDTVPRKASQSTVNPRLTSSVSSAKQWLPVVQCCVWPGAGQHSRLAQGAPISSAEWASQQGSAARVGARRCVHIWLPEHSHLNSALFSLPHSVCTCQVLL